VHDSSVVDAGHSKARREQQAYVLTTMQFQEVHVEDSIIRLEVSFFFSFLRVTA
jgi:hypothetical protein